MGLPQEQPPLQYMEPSYLYQRLLCDKINIRKHSPSWRIAKMPSAVFGPLTFSYFIATFYKVHTNPSVCRYVKYVREIRIKPVCWRCLDKYLTSCVTVICRSIIFLVETKHNMEYTKCQIKCLIYNFQYTDGNQLILNTTRQFRNSSYLLGHILTNSQKEIKLFLVDHSLGHYKKDIACIRRWENVKNSNYITRKKFNVEKLKNHLSAIIPRIFTMNLQKYSILPTEINTLK